ncbi:MAG: hypothetical protein AAB834_03830 [Patescibacteria group bacterium]
MEIVSGVETSLSDTERRKLALLDMQKQHAAKLIEKGILAQAITPSEVTVPVTRNLHICVYRLQDVFVELGGIRLKDNNQPDSNGVHIPVYKIAGEKFVPDVRFRPEEAQVIADMVGELVLMDSLEGLQLRPDLTELLVSASPLD